VNDAAITRMRERAAQLRRIADMAHDPSMVAMLRKMADEVEDDADRLDARLKPEPNDGPKLAQ
jgi:hypothetical protein